MNPTPRGIATALTVLAVSMVGTVVSAATMPQAQGGSVNGPKPPTVLFMCPHGAAKSVLASAYFERLAKERGLNVRVLSAGTDPDPQVAPAVVNHLAKNGYEVPVRKPRRATPEDLASADVVISIGCDLKDLPAPQGTLERWDDVPAPSEDFARADAKIRERVTELVDELLRKQPR